MAHTDVRKKENELFNRWQKDHEYFISDGVVDPEKYGNPEPKLLFVLKETNSEDKSWDLRDFLREGARSQTWNNITRWTMGIHNATWEEMESINEKKRIEALGSICAVNLKKTPGGANTHPDELMKWASKNREFFQSQMGLYNPDIIILCGYDTSHIFHEVLGLSDKVKNDDWKTTKSGVSYHKNYKNSLTIQHYHPQARLPKLKLSRMLVEAVKELGF